MKTLKIILSVLFVFVFSNIEAQTVATLSVNALNGNEHKITKLYSDYAIMATDSLGELTGTLVWLTKTSVLTPSKIFNYRSGN